MKFQAIRSVNTFFLSTSLMTMLLGTASLAATTNIEIKNCSSSHHEIKVKAYDYGGSDNDVETGHITVHSGDSGNVSCSTDKCHLYFHTGSHKLYKDTSSSPLYIHVKENHTFTEKAYDFCDD